MLHGVKDITDRWDSYLTPLSLGDDREEATAFEFVLVRSEPITRLSTLIALADAFSRGAAKANYDLDVFAVLLRDGGEASGGMPVVQIVFSFGNSEWTSLPPLVAAVNAEVVAASIGSGIGAPKMLRLSNPEARALTTEGGLAPMFLARAPNSSATKSAANPGERQLLLGDVRKLNEAIPARALESGAKPPVVEPPFEFPWGAFAAGVAAVLLGGLIYVGVKGQNAIDERRAMMEPNGSGRRSRKDGRRKVGVVGVDSGQLIVGDPAYFVSKDSGMSGVLKAAMKGKGRDRGFRYKKTGKPGLGYMTSTGWGDGLYPVYATYRGGRVAKLEVEFMGQEKGKKRRVRS